MGKRLEKQEWVTAALRLLAEQGEAAVRVEPLARSLKVTKGSFYWHFADRDALLSAVLDCWKTRATQDIIDTVQVKGGTPVEKLWLLLEIVFHADGKLDRQIRAWAARDEIANAAQCEIDDRRTTYVQNLFEMLGFNPADASARAHFAYHALIGQFALRPPDSAQPERDGQLDIIFRMLVRR